MLSTENPQPDPLNYSETSQLKSGSCCNKVCGDERALSDGGHPQLEVVDLCKSGLDDNSPLPNFSIRDYVFNTRGQDIANHWPFSPKNLQLCLKNGVKNVLPPFDFVRTPSSVKPVDETVISNFNVKLSDFGDHRLCVSNNVVQKLTLDVENIQSSGCEEEKENPSTTSATQSNSCVKSVSVIEISCLEAEVENLPQSFAGKPEISVIPACNKVEINSQALVNKCRSIVKLSSIAELKPNEELLGNVSVESETMASKVCPVCKTFSSSSNTTLNAHIDQCLSGESPIKWTENLKANKHRIKPKKTRLVVNIYATALHCTLEDLDRRNGTSWASNLDISVHDTDQVSAEEKNGASSVDGEDKNDGGTVYFDSNGTKLRILSKFGDHQSNLNGDDFGPRKLFKTDEGSKCITIKKKNRLIHRRKLEKCPSRERSCSPQPDSRPEAVNASQRNFLPEEVKSQSQSLNARDQLESDDFGKIKQWVGSKRTVPKQKINLKCENQHLDKIVKHLRPNRHPASVSDKFIKRSHDLNFKRMDNLSYKFNDEYMEEPCLRREGVSSLSSQGCLGKRGHPMLSKCNVQSREDGPSVCRRSLRGAESHASPWSSKKMKITSSTGNGRSSFIRSRISHPDTISPECEKFGLLTKTATKPAILSGCKKLTSVRKNALSVKYTSSSKLKKSGKKILDFRKHQAHCASRSYDEAITSVPAVQGHDRVEMLGKNSTQMEKATTKLQIDGAMVLENRKGREGSASTTKEGNLGLTGSDMPQECDSYGAEKMGSFRVGDVPADTSNAPDVVKEVEVPNGFVCDLISKFSSNGETCRAFGDSFDSRFPVVGASSDDKLGLQNYVAPYEERCADGLMAVGEQENCCTDKVVKGVVTLNTILVADGDASKAQRSYCGSVNPIPIPSPPGSFLPSPGRMGSEELQGNSSLTTCRVFSSEDEHELADMDTSESPASATSFASDSVASQGVPHDSQCAVFEERMDPGVESSISFEQAACVNEKLKLIEAQVNMIPETSPDRFRNSQPCCCSRTEGVLRNVLCGSTLRSENPSQMEQMPETEKAGANSLKECAPITVYHSSEAKFPTFSDCESPSPSTSSSVLRLMGKNLMVVKNEENQSPQVRHLQSSMLDNHPGLQSSRVFARGNIQSELNTLSQGPSTFSDMQTYTVPHYVHLSSSDGYTLPARFRTPESYPCPSKMTFSGRSFASEGLSPSLKCREYADRCNLRATDTYEPDKVQTSISRLKTTDSLGALWPNEIIVIDNSLDNKASLSVRATHNKVMETGQSSAFISNSRVSPFCTYQTPLNRRSQMLVQNATTWNRNPGGASAFCPDSATASPGHHLRASLYVSPGFPSPKNFT